MHSQSHTNTNAVSILYVLSIDIRPSLYVCVRTLGSSVTGCVVQLTPYDVELWFVVWSFWLFLFLYSYMYGFWARTLLSRVYISRRSQTKKLWFSLLWYDKRNKMVLRLPIESNQSGVSFQFGYHLLFLIHFNKLFINMHRF